MKRFKKYIATAIISAVLVFAVIQLIRSKKESEIEMSALQQYSPVVPVEVVTPENVEIRHHITENGVLSSGAEITILSETSGKVLSAKGNIGEKVHVGQILVMVENELAESQYQLAISNLVHVEKDLARYQNLAEGEAVTQQQLETMRLKHREAQTQFIASKKQLESTTITSPVNGVIANRMVEKGTYLLPSVPLYTIVEQDRMIYTLHMAEEDLLEIGRDQEAEITIDSFPGETFMGPIIGISTVPDLSGRYKVEIELYNRGGMLRAGMSGSVLFTSKRGDEKLVIPRRCVVGSAREGKVFIISGDSVLSRMVNGRTLNETQFLIMDGVGVHDTIVLSGQLNLDEGSKVRIINQ